MSTHYIIDEVTLTSTQAQLLVDAVRKRPAIGLYRGEIGDARQLEAYGLGSIVPADAEGYSAFAVNDSGISLVGKL